MAADTHPVKQRHGVEQKGKHEGSGPQELAPLGEAMLQEPADTKAAAETGNGGRTAASQRRKATSGEILPSPRVAGEAGAEQRVPHADDDEVLLQPAVDPAVGDDVVSVADGTAWRSGQEGKMAHEAQF